MTYRTLFEKLDFRIFVWDRLDPFIGLVLSSILILASQSDTMWTGMLLLFVYSLGLGVPFLLVAML